jgi:uncharacterized membrane protein
MSKNRPNERYRVQEQSDYQMNINAKLEIAALKIHLQKIEFEKLEVIIEMMRKMNNVKG